MFIPYFEIANSSRVWIYQSNRIFSESEIVFIQQKLLSFCTSWKAHENHLMSSYKILHNRFIVLLVDEQKQKASGCSIDSSVKVIKELEIKFGIDLFNRNQIAFKKDEEIVTNSISEFKKIVNPQTIVFNNLVKTKKELENNWETTSSKSWHAKYLS